MATKEGQRIIEMVVEKKRMTFRMRRAVIADLLLTESATAAPAADPAAGQQIFKAQCGICHSVAAGVNGVGPTLFGVVGRSAGGVPGFQ
jgi:cytochrome c